MSEKNELHIKFRIQNIETLQYAVIQEDLTQGKLAFEIGFGFGIDAKSKIVRSTFHYQLFSDSKSCLLIEVAMDFLIEHECFENKFKREKQLILEKGFATHLAVITVGTTRGILHEKTRNSPLNSYPIPTINVADQITENVLFDEE